MNTLVNDTNTYTSLAKNPTTNIQTKNNRLIKSWPEKEHIDNQELTYLTTSTSLTPRIYGLPKIHKDGCPLRPIVSCINASTYHL